MSGGGFWRPGPHLILADVYRYPRQTAEVDRYTVVDADGSYAVCRIWTSYFTPAPVGRMLFNHGFTVDGMWAGLEGNPLPARGSEGIGVIAKRS